MFIIGIITALTTLLIIYNFAWADIYLNTCLYSGTCLNGHLYKDHLKNPMRSLYNPPVYSSHLSQKSEPWPEGDCYRQVPCIDLVIDMVAWVTIQFLPYKARPQAFVSAHILLHSNNHQVAA